MDGKIRKRGCSSSPSSSSKVHNYRFKRAIMVGKTRAGGGSRSSTPAPSWRLMPSSKSNPGGGGLDSPDYDGGGGRSRPVSARKLAATLWEVNEIPSPQIETRFEAQTRVNGRLKEVSKALTTSKEVLKIIHRMWAHDNIPLSSMSLVSALHGELERARLQVNHIIKDQQVDHTEVNRRFAEEKALWKTKERQAFEQLEVEKKLRRRSESLNKKLGQELAETKASFAKALKELASEKRAREIMEHDVGEDQAEAEVMKQKSVKSHEEVEKEREMMRLADLLREERVEMKLAKAKHQLRSQLETVLGNKVTGKKTGRKDEDLMMYLHKRSFSGSRLNNEEDEDGVGEVEDEIKWRNSVNELVNGKALRRSSCSIQRSISDANERGNQETFVELNQLTPRRSHGDGLHRYKSVKGLRDRILTNLKSRDFDDSGHGCASKSIGFNGRRSK